jgi:ribosome-associated protein
MEEKSRSRTKREMLALQKLGEELVALSPEQLRSLDLPAELHEAVLSAQAIRTHGAKRRQLKFIGAVMRRIDVAPVRQALDAMARGRTRAARVFRQVEAWRDQLIAGDEELPERLLGRFPGAERQRLAQLIRNARKPQSGNSSPRAARALFRYLRELLEAEDTAAE